MKILVKHLLDLMLRIQALATYHIIGENASVAVILYCSSRYFKTLGNFLIIKETYTGKNRMMAVTDNSDGIKCVLGLRTGCDNAHIRFSYYLIPHRHHDLYEYRSAPYSG